jgi:hypothetical protein
VYLEALVLIVTIADASFQHAPFRPLLPHFEELRAMVGVRFNALYETLDCAICCVIVRM